MTVNGQKLTFDGDPEMPLIVYLRDVLNVESVRYGCLMASCKTCLVYVDSARCLACSVTMSEVNDKSVTTAPAW